MGLTRVTTAPNPEDLRRQRPAVYPALLLFGLVIGLYFVFQHVEQLRELTAVRAQVADMRQNIILGEQNSLELQAELHFAASDAYVVQTARSELGFIQDGDEVYVLLGDPATEAAGPQAQTPALAAEDPFRPLDRSWWRSLLKQLLE